MFLRYICASEFTAAFVNGKEWEGSGLTKTGSTLGMVHNRSPFTSLEEEREAREKVDAFCLDVVLPLAAKTNALILCEAVSNACLLSASLRRCAAMVSEQWGGNLPFTILSATSETACLYSNANLDAEWRRVRRSCR